MPHATLLEVAPRGKISHVAAFGGKGVVVVKGKTEPVLIHEVFGDFAENSVPDLRDVLDYYRDGLRFYRSQSWDRATECFQNALQLHPVDRLSALYIERTSH